MRPSRWASVWLMSYSNEEIKKLLADHILGRKSNVIRVSSDVRIRLLTLAAELDCPVRQVADLAINKLFEDYYGKKIRSWKK